MPGLLSDLFIDTPKRYWGQKLSGLLDAASTGAEAYAGATKPYTKEQAKTIGGLLADFTPIVGDIKSGVEGVQAAKQGDYLGAGLGALGALPLVPNMGGVIKVGADWAGKTAPDIRKLAKNKDKFLYHSSDPKNLDALHYGIEPTNTGPWVSEVAQGTGVDNVDDLLENSTPLSWFSDTPSWVPAFVSRITGKPVTQVTADDIAKHGHLAIINKKAQDAENIYKIGPDGLNNGEYSTVENLRGKKMKAYETPIYGETNYGGRMEPFGVEVNEYVSTDSVTPMVQLTGDDLVQFLRLGGLLGQ